MSTETPVKKKSLLRRWRAGWITVGVIVLILAIVLAGTPWLISHQLQKWVLANGGENVSVEDVDFNPFTAELSLINVAIERGGSQSLLLPELRLKARWRDLFERRFVIESADLNGVQLTFDQSQPEQEHVAGILLKNLVAEEAATPESEDEPWTFQLRDFQLRDFKLAYKHPALQSVVAVQTFSLAGLDTDPQASPAEVSLKGTIDEAPLALEGTLDLFSGEPGFKGQLQLQRLAIQPYLKRVAEEMQQNSATVSVDSRLDIAQTAEDGLRVQQSGSWGLDAVLWQDGAMAVNARQLQWDGDISADISAQNAVRVLLDGRLQGDVLGFEDRDSALSLRDQQLVWQGRANTDLSRSKALELTVKGQLRNRQLVLDMPAQPTRLQNGELDWQGDLKLNLAEDGGLAVVAQGRLLNTGFALQRPTQQLDLSKQQLSWQGELSLQTNKELLSLESLGDLDLSGIRMQTLDEQQPLLLADGIQAQKLAIKSPDSASIGQLAVNGLRMGQEQKLEEFGESLPGFANYQALILEQVDYSAETGVHIAKVVLEAPRHALVKSEGGTWGFDAFLEGLDKLAATPGDTEAVADGGPDQVASGEAPPQETPGEMPEERLAVRIDEVRIDQGGALYIVDRSFFEPFAQKIDIDAFQLSNIDSSQPDTGSDLAFSARLATGSLDLEGQVALFAAEPTFDLKGDVQALSLLPYGVFLKKYLGYEVESGSLNAQTSLSAKEGNLDSTTQLVLNQLDIRALTEQELKALDAAQNAGLETGLSMLKDKHNTIELSVPVKGALDNIQVDPSDIINQALGSALKSGAKTYLAAALFPFGTLLVVADAAADKAMQIKLDPVVFEPGLSDLSGDFPAYLEKVAAVLEEKPEIHVKVCGVATTFDESYLIDQLKQDFLKRQQEAQTAGTQQKGQEGDQQQAPKELPVFQPDTALVQKQLKALAVERADTVTRFLIDQHKTPPKRLINCQPKIDLAAPKAKPRADLLL